MTNFGGLMGLCRRLNLDGCARIYVTIFDLELAENVPVCKPAKIMLFLCGLCPQYPWLTRDYFF